MKHQSLFLSGLMAAIIIAGISCSKENAQPNTTPPCNACLTLPSSGPSSYLNITNWSRTSNGVYQSNLDELIVLAGIHYEQIYSIEVESANHQPLYVDGSIICQGGILKLTAENGRYQLSFKFNLPTYYGETPPSPEAPSIVLKITLNKK